MSWTCRRTRRALGRLFTGELALDERLALEEHAAGCERCGHELAREEHLLRALLSGSEPPTERLDLERNLAAIHARIDAEEREAPRERVGAPGTRPRPVPADPLRPAPRRLRPLPVALASLAAAVLVLWVGRGWLLTDAPDPRTGSGGADTAVASGAPVDGTSDGGDADPTDLGPNDGELTGADPTDTGTSEFDSTDRDPAADPNPGPRAPLSLADLTLEPLDAELRDAARAELRTLLAELGASSGPAGPSSGGLRARVRDAGTVPEPWPLARLAEPLVDDPDPGVARAAARLLGEVGDPLAVSTLERALERPDLAPAALRALEDLEPHGPRARRARLAAFVRPSLRELLVARAEGLPATERVRFVREVLDAEPDLSGDALADPVLHLLAGDEEELARALLELAADPRLPRARVLDALADHPLGVDVLEEELGRRRGGVPVEVRIAATGRLAPLGALEYLRGETARSRHREAAARALAQLPDPRVVEALVELEAGRVLEPEGFLEVWEAALTRDPARALEHARRLVGKDRRSEARRYLELCLLVEQAPLAATVLELAASEGLPDGDRRLAFESLARVGDAFLLADAAARLTALDPRRSELAADLLVLVHALGGEAAVRERLGEGPGVERLLERLARGPARGRYRIEHELVPVLERLQRNRPKSES